MKFGRLNIDDCTGAVLAHHQRLSGKRLSKGTKLDSRLLAQLKKEGLDTLIVAQAEAGDIAEDEVAERLAGQLACDGLETSTAATGRVNFRAAQRGIVRYEREDVTDFNLVDEGVALSLVPPNQLLHKGQMAATLKIIPYFISSRVVAQLGRLLDSRPLFSFHPLKQKQAVLIQTRNSTLPEKVYHATEAVTGARLESLGSQLAASYVCAHDQDQLTAEIERAKQTGCGLILLCGGTAIADRNDVLPAAVVQSGGVVEQLGLAVDPGNMLMVARIGEVPVIGMPGCARSPKLNGFDWVLHLLLAGLPLSRRELAAMGAGGLLTEIASRPLPRAFAGRPALADGKMGCLLLAAGQSRRMGDENKLTLTIDGVPVVRHAALALLASGFDALVVVTGYQADEVRACLKDLPVQFVHNPDFASGQAASVSAGVAALFQSAGDILIALGDMPLLTPSFITALCAFHKRDRASHQRITVPACDPGHSEAPVRQARQIRQGNPVIWGRQFFEELRGLSGDRGGRQIMTDYPAHISYFHWAEPSVFIDVDDRHAFEQACSVMAERRSGIMGDDDNE